MDRVKQEPDSLASSTPSPLPSPLPTGSYTDFVLRSTAPSTQTGWRYNIMKFGAVGERSIDPTSEAFIKPVKLNRKDPRTVRRLTDEDRERINRRAMEKNGMVVDGVKDEDGVKNEGDEDVKKEREEMDMSLVGTGTSGLAPAVRNKNNMFKKKTKRVFVSSEEARRLKREEWMPWVLEDDEGNERWIGRLEGGTGESGGAAAAQSGITSAQIKQDKADKNGTGMKGWRPPSAPSEAGGGGSSYVAFVFGDNGDEFQVVPVNRWYKFSQGPKYVTLGTDEAETEVRRCLRGFAFPFYADFASSRQYERQQKSQDPERWIMHRRNAPASGSSTPVGPVASTSSSSKPRVKKEAAPAPAAATIRSRLLDKSVLSARRASAPDRAGRPKFKSVDVGGRGEDEDDELSGRKTKGDGGRGQEQEHDEFDYEEDFQDDEEGIATIDDLADEEETKKLEVRRDAFRRSRWAADAALSLGTDQERDEDR
jgi:transcription initiation factor TFIIF subunit alpha